MRKFELEIKRSVSGNDPLPAGGYVAKIMNAEVKEYTWGEVLVISFDVAEGEYKDFFANQYRANTNEDKKWKGNFRLTVPSEGNQYFDSQKRTFGNALACIEESNSGYHWDWNEAKLKGKMVGVLFRNFEWEMNGNSGWSTEACTLVSVDDVRSGNFKMPKDKPLKKKESNSVSYVPASYGQPNLQPIDDGEDLPF